MPSVVVGFRDWFGFLRCLLCAFCALMIPVLHADPIKSFLDNFKHVGLVDQHGKKLDTDALSGHVMLFNFIFTGCDSACPVQTQVLAQVLQALPTDVRKQTRFISVSIDPGNDTPQKLKHFADRMQADLDGWQFVTGDVLQLQDIARRLHLLDEADPNTPTLHRTSLWLIDSEGRMLQRYKGNPPDRERLIRELIQVSQLHDVADRTLFKE